MDGHWAHYRLVRSCRYVPAFVHFKHAHTQDATVAGVHVIWSISRPVTNPSAIFAIQTGQWVVSFYSLTLATNLIATGEFTPS